MVSKPIYFQQNEYSESNDQSVNLFNLKEIFETHYKQVYRIVFRMTRSKQEAEDITQDVFIKLFIKLRSFNHNSSFETWIYRIAVNTALDKLRWYKRFTKREIHSENIDSYIAEESTTDTHLPEPMLNALAKVKPKNRIALILRDLEGFSYKEIADILDISKGTVASRLNRGYEELRGHLRKNSSGNRQSAEGGSK